MDYSKSQGRRKDASDSPSQKSKLGSGVGAVAISKSTTAEHQSKSLSPSKAVPTGQIKDDINRSQDASMLPQISVDMQVDAQLQ